MDVSGIDFEDDFGDSQTKNTTNDEEFSQDVKKPETR